MAEADRPNILFIHTDEQRWDTLGCYGNDIVETPNIDRLAETGVTFENAHCTHPLCTPARGSLLTGRYPNANGQWRNGIPLPREERTIADILGDNGYDTALIGKGHFGPYNGDPDEHPESVDVDTDMSEEECWDFWRSFDGPYYGFDHVEMTIGHSRNGIQGGHYGLWLRENHPDKLDAFQAESGVETEHAKFRIWQSAAPVDIHSSTWVADRTVDYLEERDDEDDPFFGWIGIPDPHFPFDPPEPYCDRYDPEEMPLPVDMEGEVWDEWDGELPEFMQHYFERHNWSEITEEAARKMVAYYYAMVDMVDDSVGRILDTLEETGMADDTIVVFTSDHGDWLGDHDLWLKGAVHTRGVTQVPWIVNWPGVAEPGRRVSDPASQIDMVPTLLDAAGVDVPYGVQGESLRPVLTGEADALRPFALVQHRHETHREDSFYAENHADTLPGSLVNPGDEEIHIKTIVTDRYRLSHFTGIEREYGELFDHHSDPDECHNLWREEPELRNELEAQLVDALVHAEDPLPERKYPV